jgi:hypothetical protein
MRAMRQAVQNEAYMTLTLPSADEDQAGLAATPWAGPTPVLTFAGR